MQSHTKDKQTRIIISVSGENPTVILRDKKKIPKDKSRRLASACTSHSLPCIMSLHDGSIVVRSLSEEIEYASKLYFFRAV